ncbi:unnamed protein product [Linum tenue]|uniref:CCT domain-containing protein n=1 Tax=Linum tenue TaxID=586396 RepID=A0AAV0MVJ7_9ROSI|nr:unnamed protein product [Linum tenue]
MDSQHYPFFCSDFNVDGDDQLIINKFSEEELSEIMLSLVANHQQENSSLISMTPMNAAAMAISSSPSLHDILNTASSSSCSFESERGSPLPPAARYDGVHHSFSLDRDHEAILFNNIASGMMENVDGGSITTSFDAATCYRGQQPAAAAANYGTTTTQLCNNNNADVKVGQYTAEERKDRILRYLKKRNQRNFNKTIKYACRKTLADRRVRVRGRFARNSSSELSEEDVVTQRRPSENDGHQHYYHHHYQGYYLQQENNQSYNENEVQLVDNKAALQMMREGGGGEEEDQWLQEAMASLLYTPYIAAG